MRWKLEKSAPNCSERKKNLKYHKIIVFAVVFAGREFLSVETFCSSFRTARLKQYSDATSRLAAGWRQGCFFCFLQNIKIVNSVSQKVVGAVRALLDWTDRSRWAYVPLRLPSPVLESGPHWATVLLTEDSLWRPRWREADVLLGGQPTGSGHGATTAGRKIYAPAWKVTALFVHIVNTPPNTSHPTHLFLYIFLSIFFLQACRAGCLTAAGNGYIMAFLVRELANTVDAFTFFQSSVGWVFSFCSRA